MAKKVLLLGATGTIGRATQAQLLSHGYEVIAPVRPGSDTRGLHPSTLRHADPVQVVETKDCHAIVSCISSRTGLDAWQIDYQINSDVLRAAQTRNVSRFVLLSAICVQKPKLEFQHAKRAFEAELQQADLDWNIVRPTAFFKSLSGQIQRLRDGKPFLVFGDGKLTACKPISDRDTANYLVKCLSDKKLNNRILPIGGPGPAITPLEQGAMLSEALGIAPSYRHVSPRLLTVISQGLGLAAPVSAWARRKSELAKIGHYYATESMLVWDEGSGRYDAGQTPEVGSDTLAGHFQRLASGAAEADLKEHAVF